MFILSAINFFAAALLMRKDDTMICNAEGTEVLFTKCGFGTIFYLLHNFTTMQTAAVVRAVFVKTIKKKDPRALSLNKETDLVTIQADFESV